jgi:hypothetical protein
MRQLSPGHTHFFGSARPSVQCDATRFFRAHAASSAYDDSMLLLREIATMLLHRHRVVHSLTASVRKKPRNLVREQLPKARAKNVMHTHAVLTNECSLGPAESGRRSATAKYSFQSQSVPRDFVSERKTGLAEQSDCFIRSQ